MNTDEVRAKFENDCLPEWLSYSGATNCYHLKEEFRGGLWYGRRDEYNDKWEGYQQGIKDSEAEIGRLTATISKMERVASDIYEALEDGKDNAKTVRSAQLLSQGVYRDASTHEALKEANQS